MTQESCHGVVPYDQTDARILTVIQSAFPVTGDPCNALAAGLGLSAEEVFRRLGRLRAEKAIRRIGAVLETEAFGFARTLVALRVDPERVEEAAGVVNSLPGVTHNYLREAEYNMWFTLSAPDEARLLERFARASRAPGVLEAIHLPTKRTFKIEAFFDFGFPRPPSAPRAAPGVSPCTGAQRRLLDCLQRDLPADRRPFRSLAGLLNMGEDAVLREIAALRDGGWIRRFAAVLDHRRLGFLANALCVWNVPPERVEEAGRGIARSDEVTHCYERAPAPSWPYAVYAMVHGRTREQCAEAARRICAAVGMGDCRLLFSTREFKKSSPTLPWSETA